MLVAALQMSFIMWKIYFRPLFYTFTVLYFFFFPCKSTILLEFILRTILPCKLCRIFFPLLRKPRTILTISVASMQCGNVLVRHVWKGAVVQEVGVEFYLS